MDVRSRAGSEDSGSFLELLSHQGVLVDLLEFLGAIDLASTRLASKFLRAHVLTHASKRCEFVQKNPVLSRWRNTSEVKDDVRTLREFELCLSYFRSVAGRYDLPQFLGPVSILEIGPDGHFLNRSLDHRFAGIATIAKVVSLNGSLRQTLPSTNYLFHFDRWYTSCQYHGRRLTVEDLGFVGPGYQCFSVSAYGRVGTSLDEFLFECRPCPSPELGWDTVPIHDRPIGEGDIGEEEDDDDDEEGADEDDPPPPNRLRRIGRKSMSWSQVLADREQGQYRRRMLAFLKEHLHVERHLPHVPLTRVIEVYKEIGIPEAEVRRTMSLLLEDGFVFNTVDDDHFACTEKESVSHDLASPRLLQYFKQNHPPSKNVVHLDKFAAVLESEGLELASLWGAVDYLTSTGHLKLMSSDPCSVVVLKDA